MNDKLRLPDRAYPEAPEWLIGPPVPFVKDWRSKHPPLPVDYTRPFKQPTDPRGRILDLCLYGGEDLLVPSADQMEALLTLLERIQNAPKDKVTVLTIQGRGGTGKSTVSKLLLALASWLGHGSFQVAPTGKAAEHLTRVSGRPCRTVHSVIYGKPVEEALCGSCMHWTRDLAECGTCPCGSKDAPVESHLIFQKADQEDPILLSGEICLVEEAAMLHKRVGKDLIDGCAPGSIIIGIGDHNQNFPIAEKGEDPESTRFFDLSTPTVELTQVHRQAADSEILAWCSAIADEYSNKPKEYERPEGGRGEVKFIDKDTPKMRLRTAAKWRAKQCKDGNPEATALLTYTNPDRTRLNKLVRRYLKRHGTPLALGEFLIGRANQRGKLMNGETATVSRILGGWKLSTGDTYTYCEFESHGRVFSGGFVLESLGNLEWVKWKHRNIVKNFAIARARRDEPEFETTEDLLAYYEARKACPKGLMQVDYGYCITGHASQGSEYTKVVIHLGSGFYGMWYHDEASGRRWLYTAASRAQKWLGVVG